MNQRTLKEIQALINAAYANGNGYDGAARWFNQQNPGENFNSLVRERNRLQQNPVQPPQREPFNSQMTWVAPVTRVTAPPWPEEQPEIVMDIPVDQNVLNPLEQLSVRMGDGPEMERIRQIAAAFNREQVNTLNAMYPRPPEPVTQRSYMPPVVAKAPVSKAIPPSIERKTGEMAFKPTTGYQRPTLSNKAINEAIEKGSQANAIKRILALFMPGKPL